MALLVLACCLIVQSYPTVRWRRGSRLSIDTVLRATTTPAQHPANHWQSLATSIIEDNLEKEKSFGLKARPGYAFGLGSDAWSASRYNGTVEGWSGSTVNWISRSLFQRMTPLEDDIVGKKAIADQSVVLSQLNMNFYMTPLVDVPHMRLCVSSTGKRHSLFVDYLPRVDLITSMDYFDKYFSKVEEALYKEVIEAAVQGAMVMGRPDTVLSRLLHSPFALGIEIDASKDRADAIIQGLCIRYIRRWQDWVTNAVELPIDQRKTIYARDQQLQRLHFDDQKFALARVMGAEFAPKAAELSAAVMGPALGEVPYYFLGSDSDAPSTGNSGGKS